MATSKQQYRTENVIAKRVSEFSARFGCDKSTALKYLKATNYCPNYASANYQRDTAA